MLLHPTLAKSPLIESLLGDDFSLSLSLCCSLGLGLPGHLEVFRVSQQIKKGFLSLA